MLAIIDVFLLTAGKAKVANDRNFSELACRHSMSHSMLMAAAQGTAKVVGVAVAAASSLVLL